MKRLLQMQQTSNAFQRISVDSNRHTDEINFDSDSKEIIINFQLQTIWPVVNGGGNGDFDKKHNLQDEVVTDL